jgi:hypothetical protein
MDTRWPGGGFHQRRKWSGQHMAAAYRGRTGNAGYAFCVRKLFNFQWSRDGRLVLSRGTETTDAVLIRNFRAGKN